MTEEEASQEQVEEKAEEIVTEGNSITEGISNLVLETLKAAENGIGQFGKIAESILSGALKSIEASVPEDTESTLRQVHTGLTDAAGKAAESIKLTFEEAKSRGATLAEDEYKQTVENLSALEDELTKTLQGFAKRTTSELTGIITSIMQHATTTGSSIRPSIEAALNAAKNHPTELVKESAQAGIDLSRSIAVSLLSSAAELLDSTARSLGAEKKED